jgi:cytidylate kinase
MLKKIIAIDGPAASGKSTVAALLAERLHIPYINTGNMYRAITWKILCCGIDLNNSDKTALNAMLDSTELLYQKDSDGEFRLLIDGAAVGNEIRTAEITSFVSKVAAIPEVRAWLLERQRQMVKLGLIVMEGRDIGTVVFPDAEYKFFITASPTIRAQRRLLQSGETFDGATLESVARDIAERDRLDSTRKIAPLRQAETAQLIDTTELTIAEVVEQVISKLNM